MADKRTPDFYFLLSGELKDVEDQGRSTPCLKTPTNSVFRSQHSAGASGLTQEVDLVEFINSSRYSPPAMTLSRQSPKKINQRSMSSATSRLATHFRDTLQREICPGASRAPTVLDEFDYY